MTINEIITLKYNDLLKLCRKNTIREIEFKNGITDIEDNDLLNTLCLRWLKKYKCIEFENKEVIYNKLKTEFLGEIKYQKYKKQGTKYLVELSYYL